MEKLIAFISLVVILSGNILPQAADSTREIKTDALQQQKIETLQYQLEATEKYLGDMTNTVYWSLSILVAVAVLLVGFGWFSNFKVYQRDKISIKDELKNLLKAEASRQNSEIVKLRSEALESINKQLESVKKVLDSESKKYSKLLISEIESEITKIRSEINQVSRQNQKIVLKNLENERRYWELKEVAGNEFTVCLRILEHSIKLDIDHEISGILSKIFDLVKSGIEIYHSDEIRLIELLDQLSNKFSESVFKIKELLRR